MSDPQQPNPHQLPPYVSQPGQPGPGQPYGQPQYAPPRNPPAQQHSYILNGQPATSAGAPATGSNPAGRIGLILGLVAIGLGLVSTSVTQALIRSVGYEVWGLVSGGFAIVIMLSAIAALIFGIVGLRRQGAPKGTAGIATGIGLAVTIGSLFSWIVTTIGNLLYF